MTKRQSEIQEQYTKNLDAARFLTCRAIQILEEKRHIEQPKHSDSENLAIAAEDAAALVRHLEGGPRGRRHDRRLVQKMGVLK